jgi:hypothetical protein
MLQMGVLKEPSLHVGHLLQLAHRQLAWMKIVIITKKTEFKSHIMNINQYAHEKS